MLVAAKLVVLRRSFIRGFSTKVHPPEAAAAAASTVSASTSPVIALKDRSLSSQLFSDVTTNLSPSIKRKLAAPKLFGMPHHPLSQLKREIESFLQSQHYNHFAIVDSLDNPIVTVRQNFDELLIGPDHPGRAATDTYYVNKDHVLRTHTSAHQSEVLGSKRSNAYLISADVYRRDEIDTTHYPVFHQMEGIYTFSRSNLEAETVTRTSSLSSSQTPTHFSSSSTLAKVNNNIQNIPMKSGDVQSCHTLQEAMLVGDHLKYTLEGLVRHLFSHEKNLEIRWIDAYFPFTSPSWEMEVLYQGKWLELFGCGVMRQSILDKTGNSDRIGWAFGLGLERIAMVLYSIPDIRLFWSEDPRFHSQFTKKRSTNIPPKTLANLGSHREMNVFKFQPFSKYPACYKDISFWCGTASTNQEDGRRQVETVIHDNDFCDLVREVAGDLAEEVHLIDEFVHPKTKKVSRCYRINYRSTERVCTNEEIDKIQDRLRLIVADRFPITLRD